MNATNTAPASLNLRFDFEAILCLEEAGFDLMKDGLKKEDLDKAKSFLTFVWAGLKADNPDLTLEDTRKQIKGRSPKDIVKAVTDALVRDLGKGTDETKSEPSVPNTPASS